MKNNKLRLLIAGDKTRFIHLKQLIAELGKIGIESKLIYDLEFIDKFFEMNIKKKIDRNKNFREMLNEFNPDAVLLDRISKIGKNKKVSIQDPINEETKGATNHIFFLNLSNT